MTCYSIEPRARKYVKRYGFLSFTRKLYKNMKKGFWILLKEQD